MSIRSRLQDFLASRLTPAITPDAEPAEFPPSEGVEPFAVPRWAQPAPVVSIGGLERMADGHYGFKLTAPIAVYALVYEQPGVGMMGVQYLTNLAWVTLGHDYAIDRDCAEATYAHLCAVIRAADGERSAQEDAQ